jgi:hypothetical protein
LETVQQKVSQGAGNLLPWDTILVGHPKCHTYVPTLAVNGKAFGFVINWNWKIAGCPWLYKSYRYLQNNSRIFTTSCGDIDGVG